MITTIPYPYKLNKRHPIARGLVGFWPLNEKNGSRAFDVTGNNNHGTLVNMALQGSTSNWTGSPFGGGLIFDGVNDSVEVNTSTTIEDTNDVSVHCWIKVNSAITGKTIISKYAAQPCEYELLIATNTYWFRIDNNSNVAKYATGTTTTTNTVGKWVNLVGTYNQAALTLKIYVNGVLEGTGTTDTRNRTRTDKLTFGKRAYVGAESYCNCSLAMIRIYNRTLSAEEIKMLYLNPDIDLLRKRIGK